MTPASDVATRVIPCLDVDAGRVVKGVNFANLRDAGDPVELAAAYDAEGADELTFLDVTASSSGRSTMLEVVRRTTDGIAHVPAGEVPGLAPFDGAGSGLVDDEDLAAVTSSLAEGALAVVLVYEVLVMNPVVAALVSAGARVLADGPVEPEDLQAQLDEREAAGR